MQLARWLASAEHPLTARVMVNRIWQHHFGRGLVATSGNFGKLGARPTHPELLDWLASRFVESGWSVKAMHRLMLLSSAYQQGDDASDLAFQRDPEDELLRSMRPRRLEAEEVRDSLLAISGRLDTTVGGTLFTEGYTANDEKRKLYVVDISGKDPFPPFEHPRRSVYLPVLRNARPEALRLFDVANEHESCSVRGETTVAPQALFLLNSPFVRESAAALAERLLRDSAGVDPAQRESQMTDRLYTGALGRPPTAEERDRVGSFVSRYARAIADMGADEPTRAAWDVRTSHEQGKPLAEDLPEFMAWEAVCQSIFCSNEFMYLK